MRTIDLPRRGPRPAEVVTVNDRDTALRVHTLPFTSDLVARPQLVLHLVPHADHGSASRMLDELMAEAEQRVSEERRTLPWLAVIAVPALATLVCGIAIGSAWMWATGAVLSLMAAFIMLDAKKGVDLAGAVDWRRAPALVLSRYGHEGVLVDAFPGLTAEEARIIRRASAESSAVLMEVITSLDERHRLRSQARIDEAARLRAEHDQLTTDHTRSRAQALLHELQEGR